MSFFGLIYVVVVGVVLAGLGRLLTPRSVPLPTWLAITVGVIAAAVGAVIASLLGMSVSSSIGWILFSVIVALIAFVGIAAGNRRRHIGLRPIAVSGATAKEARQPPAPNQGSVSESAQPPDAPPVPPMPATTRAVPARSGVFVSYRRTDTSHAAARIADRLTERMGTSRVFIDVDSLPAGLDFHDGVLDAIERSAVMLVLIGHGWATAVQADGRPRLSNRGDYVRIEIEAGLRSELLVVPILIDGAMMPSADDVPASLIPLIRRHALRISHESFATDITRLISVVTDNPGKSGATRN